jgi:hypothetical protein
LGRCVESTIETQGCLCARYHRIGRIYLTRTFHFSLALCVSSYSASCMTSYYHHLPQQAVHHLLAPNLSIGSRHGYPWKILQTYEDVRSGGRFNLASSILVARRTRSADRKWPDSYRRSTMSHAYTQIPSEGVSRELQIVRRPALTEASVLKRTPHVRHCYACPPSYEF